MKQILKKIVGVFAIPLSFLLIGYIFIGIIFQPYIRPLVSIYELFSMDTVPDFTDTAKDLTNRDSEILESGYFDKMDVGDIKVGDTYGKISIQSVDIEVPLLYGATTKTLYYGAGQRVQSSLPGFGKPTMIGGHTIPYFKNLGNIQNGDNIVITSHYGKFTYEVTGTRVASETDESAYDLTQSSEELILFTCYPLDGIGEKEDRLFVYANKVKGPQISEENHE